MSRMIQISTADHASALHAAELLRDEVLRVVPAGADKERMLRTLAVLDAALRGEPAPAPKTLYDTLYDVVKGDVVTRHFRVGRVKKKRLVVVEDVTKTKIVCGGDQFWKKTGKRVGSSYATGLIWIEP